MRSRTRRLLASVILLDALPAFLAVVNASCQFACDSFPIWTGFAVLLQLPKFGDVFWGPGSWDRTDR